jgi:hypothetical protein
MPKRVVDGDAIATSEKLTKVDPPKYRAEFSLLLTLALANGVFEADPRKVWAKLYAFNRPDLTPEMTAEMLDQYEKAKMLFRWKAEDEKLWGYWVGIEKRGRLPGESRWGSNEKMGPLVPKDKLAEFVGHSLFPDGNGSHPGGNSSRLGIGIGNGIGNCNGSGSGLGAGIGNGIDAGNGNGPASPVNANVAPPSFQGASKTQNTNTTPKTHRTPSAEAIVDAYPMEPNNDFVRKKWIEAVSEWADAQAEFGASPSVYAAQVRLLERVQRYAISKPKKDLHPAELPRQGDL